MRRKRADIYGAIISQNIHRKASELEEEIEDKLAGLSIPPCIPLAMAHMMRSSGPLLAWFLAATLKEMSARWN